MICASLSHQRRRWSNLIKRSAGLRRRSNLWIWVYLPVKGRGKMPVQSRARWIP
jgi:hypothetical protein